MRERIAASPSALRAMSAFSPALCAGVVQAGARKAMANAASAGLALAILTGASALSRSFIGTGPLNCHRSARNGLYQPVVIGFVLDDRSCVEVAHDAVVPVH